MLYNSEYLSRDPCIHILWCWTWRVHWIWGFLFIFEEASEEMTAFVNILRTHLTYLMYLIPDKKEVCVEPVVRLPPASHQSYQNYENRNDWNRQGLSDTTDVSLGMWPGDIE